MFSSMRRSGRRSSDTGTLGRRPDSCQGRSPGPIPEAGTPRESGIRASGSGIKEAMATVVSAIEMGARQREISVSEFFTKNRHLLGFDNPRKALLTCVKEAVDNALDAAEEAGILPDVAVA